MSDPLHRFATRVVELQNRKESESATTLDPDTMMAVARDLGMNDEEIRRLIEESRTAKQKAKTLRMAGNLHEAIDTLETAHAFHPLDLETTYALADALFALSQRPGDLAEQQATWARARDLARAVIDAAPAHGEAATLLGAIKNNEPQAKDTSVPWNLIIAIVVGIAVVAAGIALLLL